MRISIFPLSILLLLLYPRPSNCTLQHSQQRRDTPRQPPHLPSCRGDSNKLFLIPRLAALQAHSHSQEDLSRALHTALYIFAGPVQEKFLSPSSASVNDSHSYFFFIYIFSIRKFPLTACFTQSDAYFFIFQQE